MGCRIEVNGAVGAKNEKPELKLRNKQMLTAPKKYK
jgi:hypothetical protein